MKNNNGLKFECEFACKCNSLIQLKTYLAVVQSKGQLVVCRHCKREYRVFQTVNSFGVVEHEGAEYLGRSKNDLHKDTLYPPVLSSYGIQVSDHAWQPGHEKIELCTICGTNIREH